MSAGPTLASDSVAADSTNRGEFNNWHVEADRLGFHTTLVAKHEVNPAGDHFHQLEPWITSAAPAI
jgi:alkanesulfonate monooxygenase SsuD/methylene tetrahydromethanopterin reductase-like flavin-dependent oxidoreductase (luciferase family)